MSTELTVFVVDDDEEVRNSMKRLMNSVRLTVETFASGEEFLAQFDPARPGCLLLDVRMEGMSGLEVQERLALEDVQPPIIIITGHGDVPMAVRALQAGALHFLEKPFRDQEILDCVQETLELAGNRHSTRLQKDQILGRMETLTPREYQIMKDIVKGHTNRSIGEKHDISTKTVEIHRTRVMHKMEAGTLPDLVRMALAVEPDD